MNPSSLLPDIVYVLHSIGNVYACHLLAVLLCVTGIKIALIIQGAKCVCEQKSVAAGDLIESFGKYLQRGVDFRQKR